MQTSFSLEAHGGFFFREFLLKYSEKLGCYRLIHSIKKTKKKNSSTLIVIIVMATHLKKFKNGPTAVKPFWFILILLLTYLFHNSLPVQQLGMLFPFLSIPIVNESP